MAQWLTDREWKINMALKFDQKYKNILAKMFKEQRDSEVGKYMSLKTSLTLDY